MKFLADMGIAQGTVAFLRDKGHDVVHLRDQGLHRMDDRLIVEKARAEGRIILVHDLDFSRIVALSGAGVPSVITFRLKSMRPLRVNWFLTGVLAQSSEALLKGALASVTESGVRVRMLPVKR